MAAPLLNHVAFDEPTQADNGQGGTISGWLERFCTRAHFKYLRGGETVLQARLSGQQTVVVKVRNSAAARSITPVWRMRDLHRGSTAGEFPGVIYNIRSIIPSDDRLYLELTCQSGVAT